MRIYLFSIILILFTSCAIQEVEMVKFNGYNVSGIDQKEIKLNLRMTLNNPNGFNIKVKKTKLNISINGNDGGEVKLADPVKIVKKSETDYEFIMVADAQKIKSAVVAGGISIALTGKVNLNVKGWVKGKAFVLGKKIDVDYKESFSLKDLDIGM